MGDSREPSIEEMQERAIRILNAYFDGTRWTSEEMGREYSELKVQIRRKLEIANG